MENLIAAELEALADRCRDELAALQGQPEQGEPTVRDEIRFYERQLRAFEKALGYWLQGVRPMQTPSDAWLIPSGSRPGAQPHRCEKQGHLWICGPTCEARGFHWHPALMTAIEQVAERLAAQAEADLFAPEPEIDPEPFLPAIVVEQAARVVVVARPFGQRLAEARAAYL